MALLDQFQAFLISHKELVELMLKSLSGLALLIGAAIGLHRYLFDQKWRRKQFAYDYAERIFDEPDVKLAMQMIDWSAKTITADEAKRLGCSQFMWNPQMIATALDNHDLRAGGQFELNEHAIRTVFDAFLARFDRLGDFVDCGILNIKDFPGSLKYYVTIMNEPRLSPISKQLNLYMIRYGSPKARKLFARLGAAEFA